MKKSLMAVFAVAGMSAAFAQVNYNLGPYTQNFNTLATAGVNVLRPTGPSASTNVAGQVWDNNSTITGWYSSFENPANVAGLNPHATNGNWIGAGVLGTTNTIPTYDTRFIRVNDGSTTATGATSNYGTVGSSDRALGIMNSGSVGSTVPVRNTIALRLTNMSSITLNEFTLGYWGEQWRQGAGTGSPAPAADRLDFAYRVFNSGSFNVDQLPVTVTAGWTDVNALDFNSVKTGTVLAVLDGNAADNRVFITSRVTGLVWAPGQDLVLRWTDFDRTGSDDGLAVDDVIFTVPEPSSMLALGLGALMLRRRRSA